MDKFEMSDEDNVIYEDDIEVWELDFTEDRPMDSFECLRQIDTKLCDFARIGKIKDGRFLLMWTERHPERGRHDEYFPKEAFTAKGYLKPQHEAEWEDIKKRMPDSEYSELISRRDAFQMVAYFWLPDEFHSDAML